MAQGFEQLLNIIYLATAHDITSLTALLAAVSLLRRQSHDGRNDSDSSVNMVMV